MNSLSLGYPDTGKPFYTPTAGPDGLMRTSSWLTINRPYPLAPVRKPERYGLEELIPTAIVCSPLAPFVMNEPERFGMPYKIKFHLHFGNNYLMTLADPNEVARAFRDVFTVSFRLHLDESTYLADIVLPDACYLERWSFWVDSMLTHNAVGEWGYRIRQPVVGPLFQRRDSQEIILELSDRLGMLKDINVPMNRVLGLSESNPLSPDSKYSIGEIADRHYKSLFGDEHGLEWFKKHGVLKWPKKVEEVYWKPFVKARVPIYFELFKTVGEQIRKVSEENDIHGIDTSPFQPLPEWKPCPSHQEKDHEFDLFAIYFRVSLQTFSSTYNNPWLDEASKIDPYVYSIAINSTTARKKGIKDGDWLVIESAATHNKIKGKAHLTEAIHPEVIAMANCGGHWAKGLPLASQPGEGACIEWLIPLDLDHIDIPTLNQDLCVKVKVYKELVSELVTTKTK